MPVMVDADTGFGEAEEPTAPIQGGADRLREYARWIVSLAGGSDTGWRMGWRGGVRAVPAAWRTFAGATQRGCREGLPQRRRPPTTPQLRFPPIRVKRVVTRPGDVRHET